MERIHASLSMRVRRAAGAVVGLSVVDGATVRSFFLDLDRGFVDAWTREDRGLASLARALGQATSASVAVLVRGGDAPIATTGLVALVPFVVSLGEHSATARVHVAFDVVPHRSSARTSRSLPPTLPVPLAFTHALTRLRLSELRGLSVGDVLLPDLVFDSPVARLPRGASHDLAIRVQGRRLVFDALVPRTRVASSAAPEVSRMPPRSTASSCSEMIAAFDDAEVEVAIEIARTSLSLGELSRLESGDVLATRANLSSRVTLRVGDTLVARGDLVDVDGQFAVHILETASRTIREE